MFRVLLGVLLATLLLTLPVSADVVVTAPGFGVAVDTPPGLGVIVGTPPGIGVDVGMYARPWYYKHPPTLPPYRHHYKPLAPRFVPPPARLYYDSWTRQYYWAYPRP